GPEMTHSLDGILAEHRWAIAAGIVALLCVVLVFTDVRPRLGAAAALLGQWRRQTEKLAEVAAWDYEAATIEARRAGLISRLEDLYVNLPRSEQTSVVLQLLQESAAAENVTLDQ